MTKFHITILILGLSLFLFDVPSGWGWVLGWIFIGLLRHYRERILDYVIDFEHFSTKRYIMYLLGVMVWVAIPLLISFLLPEYINPLAVFGAFFIDRILMFVVNSFRKEAG